MPAPARISVPVKQTTPIKPPSTITPKTPASIPRHKARVMHRRRGRGQLDDTDTDEDLVREPHSDDDSETASSILDSESETASESEPEEQEAPRVPSPSHTPLINGAVSSPSLPPVDRPSAFPQSFNWSEMVAEENSNGAADLPVIDFTDLSPDAQPPSAESPAVPSPTPSPAPEEPSQDTSAAQTFRRKPGQSARQAYRKRLDTDPAYVPTLGQFWSHDDRLLDKDLRSLSGWWRGRWQGRGRGRGFAGAWGTRGTRGRKDFAHGSGPFSPSDPQLSTQEDAAPAERAWTHDGFEEMKRVDEEHYKQPSFRGRGSFLRGRGGFRGGFSGRGEPSASPNASARAPSESQHSIASDTLRFGTGTRPWFAMKPERMWTKQFDAYLYFEAPLKPLHNQGLGQGVRIRLPGRKGENGEGTVVRLPIHMTSPPRPMLPTTDLHGERAFVVKLPRGKQTGENRNNEYALLSPEDFITVAPPPMEEPVPMLPPTIPSVESRSVDDLQISVTTRPPVRRGSEVVAPSTRAQIMTDAPQDYTLPLMSSDFPAAGPSHLLPNTPQDAGLPPPTTLQTTATTFLPSPPYGSPYGYATPSHPLPPGIAVSESGVTYEVATGRAIFLHTPPPPPLPPQMQGTLYNQRPMPMHHAHHGSMHFFPPPAHHGSLSPPGILTPPIFSLPRQSSRIEIRAPNEKGKAREETEQVRPAVRSAVNVNAEPFTPAAQVPLGYYSSEGHTGFGETQPHHQFAYQPTPYYYPVGAEGGAPYGYGQYAPADVGQPQQYEQYAQDSYPHQHQHTGYY